MIILRPGFREVSIGHLAMLAVACVFCISYLTAKGCGDTRARSARTCSVDTANGGRGRSVVFGGLFCHRGALCDDTRLCQRTPHGDAAGDVCSTDLGGLIGLFRIWRSGRSMGDLGWVRYFDRYFELDHLYHVARSSSETR